MRKLLLVLVGLIAVNGIYIDQNAEDVLLKIIKEYELDPRHERYSHYLNLEQ
jgi:hypothetical protein